MNKNKHTNNTLIKNVLKNGTCKIDAMIYIDVSQPYEEDYVKKIKLSESVLTLYSSLYITCFTNLESL